MAGSGVKKGYWGKQRLAKPVAKPKRKK